MEEQEREEKAVEAARKEHMDAKIRRKQAKIQLKEEAEKKADELLTDTEATDKKKEAGKEKQPIAATATTKAGPTIVPAHTVPAVVTSSTKAPAVVGGATASGDDTGSSSPRDQNAQGTKMRDPEALLASAKNSPRATAAATTDESTKEDPPAPATDAAPVVAAVEESVKVVATEENTKVTAPALEESSKPAVTASVDELGVAPTPAADGEESVNTAATDESTEESVKAPAVNGAAPSDSTDDVAAAVDPAGVGGEERELTAEDKVKALNERLNALPKEDSSAIV